METQDWVTAGVALVSIVGSVLIAMFTVSKQARSHREQLAAQERQLQQQLDAREREVDRTTEREHFARLWEKRQDGYLELATWALRVRRSIQTAKDADDWAALESLRSETLAKIFVYADHEVYARGDGFRGTYEAVVETLDLARRELPAQARSDRLERLDEQAWALIHAVRENALRIPNWREPIPLHPHTDPDA